MKSIHLLLMACMIPACVDTTESANSKEREAVERSQSQMITAQPIPAPDWSLERHLLIQLYGVRNTEVATHSVWRGDTSVIEGDCPSMGYSLPADTSLTNPLVLESRWNSIGGEVGHHIVQGVVSQPEPNGLFASTNTMATFVFCVGPSGRLEPIQVEAKVTTYPYPVEVNYRTGEVIKAGSASFTLDMER